MSTYIVAERRTEYEIEERWNPEAYPDANHDWNTNSVARATLEEAEICMRAWVRNRPKVDHRIVRCERFVLEPAKEASNG